MIKRSIRIGNKFVYLKFYFYKVTLSLSILLVK